MWDAPKEVEKVWGPAGHHKASDLNLVIAAAILDCFQDQTVAPTPSLDFPSSEN